LLCTPLGHNRRVITQCKHKDGPSQRVRTLVVDDSELSLKTISAMLKICGRLEIVGTATDGLEALEKTRALNPDLVIMDLQMPRMNGFESASHIRKERPTTRIVHVTTHDDPQVMQASRASGADHFISKSTLPRTFCRVFCDLFGPCAVQQTAS
jgi:DNA-binding NarL/FixJ family response regulator